MAEPARRRREEVNYEGWWQRMMATTAYDYFSFAPGGGAPRHPAAPVPSVHGSAAAGCSLRRPPALLRIPGAASPRCCRCCWFLLLLLLVLSHKK